MVEKAFEYLSKQLSFKYSKIEGTLYSGISIEQFNYENNLEIKKLYLKPEILSLLVFDIYIYDLKIDGIRFDNALLENQNDQNNEENQNKTINIPFKLFIKNFEANGENYSYENYKIEKIDIKAKNITSNLEDFVSGSFVVEAKTNVAEIKGDINLEKNHYILDSNIVLNKEFIDSNIVKTLYLEKFNLVAKGDLEKIDFQIKTDKLSIKADKPVELKNINLHGNYDFSNLKLDKIESKLIYDFTSSNIKADLDMQNNNLDTLNFNMNLESLIKKDIDKMIGKDIKMNSILSGNLKEIKLKSDINSNKIQIGNELISLENPKLNALLKIENSQYSIFADLNLKTNLPNQKSKIDIKIDTSYKKNQLNINLDSKLAKISLSTKDLKKYLFNLNIKEINPKEFYSFDEKIKISKIKGNLSGIFEKNLKLKGSLLLNNLVNIETEISGNENNLEGKISNQTFSTHFFKKDNKTILKTRVNNLKNLEEELNKIATLPPLNLSGLVDFQTQIDSSNISFEISSPKISFEKENVEKIVIKGVFKDKKIFFENLDFTLPNTYGLDIKKRFKTKKEGFLDTENLNGIFYFDNITLSSSQNSENLNIKIETDNLNISHKTYGKANITSNILLSINPENKTLISGEIKAKNLKINYQIPAISISKDKDIIIVYKNKNKKEKDAFLENIALQLSIFADDLKYQVKNIDLKASANLNLKKEFNENIKIFGSIQNIAGTFSELGKRYDIKDSSIYFKGESPINPLLNINATYSLNDIDISIIIGGTLNYPKVNLSSTPIMNQKDILSYLIFGTKLSNDQTNTQSKQSQASLFLLNELSKDYAKELGIDILYFQYEPTTQYIETYIGKNLSEKNKIVLKNGATTGQVILMRELTKLWNVELGFEEKTQSLDLIYKKRY